MMIAVKVKFFAVARDLVGKGELMLSVPEKNSVADVFELLASSHPRLQEWKQHLQFAVNQQYVSSHTILHDDDEVAVIPPVSGG